MNFGQIPPPLELQAKLSESPGAVQLEKMFTVTLKLTNNRYRREGGREREGKREGREVEEVHVREVGKGEGGGGRGKEEVEGDIISVYLF